jgi:hypothetical protein
VLWPRPDGRGRGLRWREEALGKAEELGSGGLLVGGRISSFGRGSKAGEDAAQNSGCALARPSIAFAAACGAAVVASCA